MTQESKTGGNVLLTAENVDVEADNYLAKKGIFKFPIRNDALEFIKMSKQEMATLRGEEAGEAGVVLACYSASIQEAYNKEIAKVNWITSEIAKVIGPQTKQYKAASYEERKAQAIAGDDYATKLEEQRKLAQVIADKLSYMAHRAEMIARAFINLQQAKRNNHA